MHWKVDCHMSKAKIDGLAKRLDEALLDQADQRKRSDHLYQVVIDLLKAQSPKTNP